MANKSEVAKYIWETTADMTAQSILTNNLTGKISAAFVLSVWPEMIHSILENTSPNYTYGKKEFMRMSYERQRVLAGEKFILSKFAKDVERRFKIYKHLLSVGQKQQARA